LAWGLVTSAVNDTFVHRCTDISAYSPGRTLSR